MSERKRPAMDVVYGAVFRDTNSTFSITVKEADHALRHYDAFLAGHPVLEMLDPDAFRQARMGIMAACLAHAMHWDAEMGKQQMMDNPEFQDLVLAMMDLATFLGNEELYPSLSSRLS